MFDLIKRIFGGETTVQKAKNAALREAAVRYRERAAANGGSFDVGGRRWKAPLPGYDVITAVNNDRMPVKISQIVERRTGSRAINFTGDLNRDAGLVVAAVDEHLRTGL